MYIDDAVKSNILESAKLEDVIAHFVDLRPSGSDLVGECHHCNSRKGLTFNKRKKIFKCFKCEVGGKYASQYLMKIEGMGYMDSLKWLAEFYDIDITPHPSTKIRKIKPSPGSFRNHQLRSSGILDKNQKWYYKRPDGALEERDRYEAATWNKAGHVIRGNDMVLHYLDLDGRQVMFTPERGKAKPLTRIRYQYPDQNLDKHGKPVKYRSPYKSGSHLWHPQLWIDRFHLGGHIDTLVITEGEKKADALCQLKIWTVGLMGISNLSYDEMPREFNRIMDVLSVKNVIFLLDTDYQDISANPEKPVDQRPKNFYYAVMKFVKFFNTYNRRGFDIQLFFGTHNSKDHKGIDDFHVATKIDLKKQLDEALSSPDYKSEGFTLYNVTTISDFKLKKYWHLSSDNEFMQYHREKLLELKEFKLGRFKRKYNPDTDTFELDQMIAPGEQYWIPIETKHGTKYDFHYINIENFLYNRSIGLYRSDDGGQWFIHIEDKIVKKVDHIYIQRYVLDYSKSLDQQDAIDIAMFIKRGMSMYLGPQQCNLLREIRPNFIQHKQNEEILVFQNGVFRITPDAIQQVNDLPNEFWDNQVIDRPVDIMEPLFNIDRKEGYWDFKPGKNWENSDICNFMWNTSDVYWRKHRKKVVTSDGLTTYIEVDNIEKYTISEIREVLDHMVAKMLAIGYLVHSYEDYSTAKAIVCMDLKDSEIGASEGGSGKSIFSKIPGFIAPQHKIDGAAPRFQENRFRFEGMDERHRTVLIDDVRDDFDLKTEFSNITEGITVQRKGLTSLNLGLKKYIITLNGMIRGNSNSYLRRQYQLGFSDYYNGDYSPVDDFGHQMFREWDREQWNLFDNFIMQCVQLYLKHGLKYTIPMKKIEKRRLRHVLGSSFLDWADEKYDELSGMYINKEVPKKEAMDDLLVGYPSLRRYMNVRKFKEKMIAYSQYRNLDFNISAKDKPGRIIKSNGVEYICLSNSKYDHSKRVRFNDVKSWP